ncbi:MAG TPA: efflux transporter outer membrane subunit [Steroidobacteraceae bacterium]|nr:efflux transporter outer membrane subunit [Steroidobacteraceae bacterium]
MSCVLRQLARPSGLLVAGAAIACLAGCHAGPDYRPPAVPPGAEAPWVSLDSSLETSAAPPQAWWRLYDDTRLDGLVHEALAANRDLAAADANFAAARAALTAVHAQRYPSTAAVAAGVYGRDPTTDEILELGGHEPQTLWLFDDVFEAAYEVDLFGRVHRAVEQASASAASVAAARDSVRILVAAETARDYAEICALGEQLAVARHSLDIVTRESDISEQRYQAGANSQFDVQRSRALVSQVSATIPQLEGLRRAALFEVTALLGRTPVNAPHELETCATPLHLNALIPVGDGRALISRRPDVRQAERRLAAATAATGVATADLYPTIRLTAFVGGAATEVSQLTSNDARIWGVGPSISWSFPNQMGARARVRQTKAAQVAALASFDSVVLTALKETEQALSTYRATLDNRQALVDAQGSIHKSYDIAREEFAAGSLSSLDLLTTEQSLVALDAAVAASDAALVRDQIAVFKALGGGWEREASQAH